MKIAHSFALIALFCKPVVAQQQDIAPDAPPDSATLHQWFHSGDPRLIAWAADFARRQHDTQLVSDIPGILEHWSMPPMAGGYEERSSQRRAVLALLDTLIQENSRASVSLIESVADQFPAQSLLLIKSLPFKSSESTLLNWTFGRNDSIQDRRARAAAMLLARDPDPSFVYRVAKRSEQHIAVRLVSPGIDTGFGSSSVSCGDGFPLPPDPQWPVVYDYELQESESSSHRREELPVADIGYHSITALRFEENRGAFGCFTPRTEAGFRHELISYWLGIKPDAMPWQPEERVSISWTTRTAYQRKLGSIIEQQRSNMADTLQRLRDRGLMDKNASGDLVPRIVVTVECEVDPCPLFSTTGLN